ncbi:MAG: hypothetical protein ACFFAO_17430 [Candidatus Hermodarchaeota archaeon]
MFKIEKIGENIFYIKFLGTVPKSVAKRFLKEFKDLIKNLKTYSAIVDGFDLIIINLKSFKIILKFLRKINYKLAKSAYVIGKNPVLNKEVEILLERARSPKRKIVKSLEEAKVWVGIKDIIFQ